MIVDFYASVLLGPVPFFPDPLFRILFWIALLALLVGMIWGLALREWGLGHFLFPLLVAYVVPASQLAFLLAPVLWLVALAAEIWLIRRALGHAGRAVGAAWLLSLFCLVFFLAAVMQSLAAFGSL
jgi:hypothetical protein